MSEPLYQVLFRGANGRDNLSDPEPLDDAQHTARELERKGYTVGSVMDVKSASEYMEYHYATEYRGVPIPDDLRAAGTPRAMYDAWRRGVNAELDTGRVSPVQTPSPDVAMSREVADLLLRAVTGLLRDGYWMFRGYRLDDADGQSYDSDLIRRAADLVGRDQITDADLLRYLAELDSDDGEAGR